MKYLSLLLTASFFIIGCKKEPNTKPLNTETSLNAEEYYSSPKFYQSNITDMAASWNGEVIVLKNNSNFYYSKDGGNTFNQVTPSIKNYIPYVVNESGIMAWSDNFYSGFYNLNTNAVINSNIPGFYNQYYVGQNDVMYCIQGTNSSTPAIVFYKKLNQTSWDTLTKNSDSLGLYCGQNNLGGISFFNPSKKTLSNHDPINKTVSQYTFSQLDFANITQGSSNRQIKYFYNGHNLIVAGYTKGFALMNTTNLSVTYQDWESNFKGYYENPLSLSCSKNGIVYAQLSSYVNQATRFEINGSSFKTIQTNSDVINIGDYTYFPYSLNPIKSNGTNTSPIKIGNLQSVEIDYYHPYNNMHYNLIYDGGTTTQLIEDKISTYSSRFLIGYYSFIYRDNNTIIISGNDSLMYSDNEGISYNTIKNPFHHALTYLKKINGTYYALSVKNFKYNLGGTGFQTDRFNIGVYTSTNLKDWTLIPNSYKTDVNGKGPEIFSSNGLMTYNENIEPLGNPIYRGYKSTDFGVTWSSSGLIPTFNCDLGSSLALISYSGANKITRQNLNLNLEKTNSIIYTTSVSVPLSNHSPVVTSNGEILFVTGDKVLKLK